MLCDARAQGGRSTSVSPETVLRVHNLVFGYTEKNTLEGVDIDAKKGEFVALVGPNGSGKTTMMRCINKILRQREGTVEITGKDTKGLTLDEISRLCTTVPATTPLGFSLSTKEFVTLGRSPYAKTWMWESDEDVEIVEKAMWDFGILHFSERRLDELSSGERARALLAKGVVQQPKLMMVDEPSAHLDIKYKIQVMQMLKSLAENGITVLMASHDINLVTAYCDKVLLLHGGRIVDYGTPAEVVTEESMKKVFDIDVRIIRESGVPYILPSVT
ncbi:MAG: ABC transporter ATP-binding protein [Thermoplasmatales archaeon]|nr:ABC transporter ATP-binding protein [Thermoplasmatales archaeon]